MCSPRGGGLLVHERSEMPYLDLARRFRRRAEPEYRRPDRAGRDAAARVDVPDRGMARPGRRQRVGQWRTRAGRRRTGRGSAGGRRLRDGAQDVRRRRRAVGPRLAGGRSAVPRAGLRTHASFADPLPMQGGTTFRFVTDGIASALEQARTAAGDKDVLIAGGASAVQQYLAAGLLDELYLHIAPVVLGAGERLLENVGDPVLEPVKVVASPTVTHVKYRIVR